MTDALRKLVEALTECRFRLAANQPTTGPHPNDVKAFDMADAALEAAESALTQEREAPVAMKEHSAYCRKGQFTRSIDADGNAEEWPCTCGYDAQKASPPLSTGATGEAPDKAPWRKPDDNDYHVNALVFAGLDEVTAVYVGRFAKALAMKLLQAKEKYGYTDGWAQSDWEEECRASLMKHIGKGDPIDVAAFAMFMWKHQWSTTPPERPLTATDAAIPEGMVLVPKEPTEDMLEAACEAKSTAQEAYIKRHKELRATVPHVEWKYPVEASACACWDKEYYAALLAATPLSAEEEKP